MGESYDVVIVGGAVMGSSLAFWLTELAGAPPRILVVERDPSYARSATALSVASIRQQFSNPVNVRISRFGVEFIRNCANWLEGGGVADLGLRENGYLFLAGTGDQARAMREVAEVQWREGARSMLLDAQAVGARFPWIDPGGVTLGSFGARDEGWFDNMGLLGGFRRVARDRGVAYLHDEVTAIRRRGESVCGVELASGATIDCGAVVSACGTRAAALLRSLGEVLPVEARKRTVFVVDAPNLVAPDAPLLVDHSGFYLRPEGPHWITATVPEDDSAVDPDDFEPDAHLFEDVLWERLHARIPTFDAAKVLRLWTGHYDYNTLDQNAILGRWPGFPNLYVMSGFSGHGLQQAPAVGRGLAELILTGDYVSIDLSELGADRVLEGRAFPERAVV
jgi:FAD-dependent oxidoreductase domain-containing protein 1